MDTSKDRSSPNQSSYAPDRQSHIDMSQDIAPAEINQRKRSATMGTPADLAWALQTPAISRKDIDVKY